MNLEKMAEKYRDAGYSERNADARVCQDIVLKAIARSNLGRNVTISREIKVIVTFWSSFYKIQRYL